MILLILLGKDKAKEQSEHLPDFLFRGKENGWEEEIFNFIENVDATEVRLRGDSWWLTESSLIQMEGRLSSGALVS